MGSKGAWTLSGRFFFLLLLTAPCFAGVPDWAQDAQWLNLGHYKPTLFGQESQVDGPAFFLSPEGKSDGVDELARTILAFKGLKAPYGKDSALCRFPARYLWLKTKLPQLTLDPAAECADFRAFKDKLNAKSVSMVFSSYFINTPASAFGHTFLRFNSSPHRSDNLDQAELLDYGVSYSAQMQGSNPLVYVVEGLFGLSKGVFTALPYYYKVREYNDFESRDLWEYKLKFTQAQIDMMVAHAWELGPTWFDYLYFTENCAYHMLSLLEVGNPELELTAKMPSLYVIPVDTIRAVAEEPGLVQGLRYRPSVLSRLEWRSARLPPQRVRQVRDMVEEPKQLADVIGKVPDTDTRARMLETAVEAFDFLNAKELVYRPKETHPDRHELLLARSDVDVILPDEEQMPPEGEWPDRGHRSQRWGVGGGYRDGQGAFGLGHMRFALHDLLDPLPGQPAFSEIHFAGLTGRFEQNEYGSWDKLHLENLDIFRVTSVQPVTEWQRATSWTGRIGARTLQDQTCPGCFSWVAEGGVGATIGPKLSESFVSLFNKFELDHSTGFPTQWRFGVGPELWGRWVPSRKLSVLGVLGYKWVNFLEAPLFAEHVFTQSLELRYHFTQDVSLALKGEGQQEEGRAFSAGFYRFF